ncbi:hypothetical protein CFOL_v3_09697 [Cephalotus follicularis]|uniref:Longin domain-containing protein n=1 Tax=Cephalotus follicularis TaxID=3775 RepID=A0A1Q3BDT8_CEPFO|nr:hypothetical protein CFOL_v3_09697 [Cephalotus follicularis]
MILNASLVFYACIAKGTTILVDFSSKESGIETLALGCIENTPAHHSMFSHTVRQRTYTFLIDDPIVYFVIFHENLDKSESIWFLDRLKSNFEEIMASGSILNFDYVTSHCYQSHFNAIFGEMLALNLELVNSSPKKESQNPSLVTTPLLWKHIKALKKKKRSSGDANGDNKDVSEEKKVDVCDDVDACSRDFNVSVHKNGGIYVGDRQKAKQVWRKHVWVVLTLDFIVCAVLLGIWLWVCRGFQCIDG